MKSRSASRRWPRRPPCPPRAGSARPGPGRSGSAHRAGWSPHAPRPGRRHSPRSPPARSRQPCTAWSPGSRASQHHLFLAQRPAGLVLAVEHAHHDQGVVAVGGVAGDAHALAQPALLDEAFAGVQRQRARVERLHVEPEAVRVQVAEGHPLEQAHAAPAQALALASAAPGA